MTISKIILYQLILGNILNVSATNTRRLRGMKSSERGHVNTQNILQLIDETKNTIGESNQNRALNHNEDSKSTDYGAAPEAPIDVTSEKNNEKTTKGSRKSSSEGGDTDEASTCSCGADNRLLFLEQPRSLHIRRNLDHSHSSQSDDDRDGAAGLDCTCHCFCTERGLTPAPGFDRRLNHSTSEDRVTTGTSKKSSKGEESSASPAPGIDESACVCEGQGQEGAPIPEVPPCKVFSSDNADQFMTNCTTDMNANGIEDSRE